MAGLPPSDRAREKEQSNHPKFARDKERFAKKDADLEQKAREYDDDDPAKAGAPAEAESDDGDS